MKNAINAKAVKILRRVKAHILAEPRRLEMNDYASKTDAAPCGTAGCIAGWTCLLESNMETVKAWNARAPEDAWVPTPDWHEEASRLLGLTEEKADKLFMPWELEYEEDASWPKEFQRRYDKCKTKVGKAKVTAERIEHFIKTGE